MSSAGNPPFSAKRTKRSLESAWKLFVPAKFKPKVSVPVSICQAGPIALL